MSVLQDCSYTAAIWPLILAGVGMAVAIAMSVLLAIRPRGMENDVRRRLMVSLCLLGGFLVSTILAGSPLVFAVVGLASHQMDYIGSRTALGEFLPHVVVGTVFPVIAAIAVSTGGALHIGRDPGDKPGSALAPALGIVLALLLLGAGWAEAQWIVTVGPLPWVVTEQQTRVHVGRAVEIEPQLQGRYVDLWSTEVLSLQPTEPGATDVELTARRSLLKITQPQTWEAGLDDPDPLLPLAVGNSWVYQRTDSWTDTVFIVKSIPHQEKSEPVTWTVTHEQVEDGLRVFTLERTAKDLDTLTMRLYNWNGRAHSIEGVAFVELLTGEDTANTRKLSSKAPVGSELCRVGMFPGFTCLCLTSAADDARIPGPGLCLDDPDKTDSVKTLGKLFLGLASVGMIVPATDRDLTWHLISSSTQ